MQYMWAKSGAAGDRERVARAGAGLTPLGPSPRIGSGEPDLSHARLDLHTHTRFSEDRERFTVGGGVTLTVPFHPLLSPLELYDQALARGMTHVTITDHDTLAGCLDLLARHPNPDRFITGEEVSCFHRGACFHVGVYGLSEADHAAIHEGADSVDRERRCLRWNVAELTAFLRARGLAFDLKHPLWVHGEGSTALAALREVVPLFDLFEARNATRHRWLNDLGVEVIDRWRPGAGYTGGSDSHSANQGITWTETEGTTSEEVLASLRAGRATAGGEHGAHARLEDDFRRMFRANAIDRAGTFKALADDYWHNMPLVSQDLLALSVSASLAYAAVNEYARQRRLAREVRAALADELGAPAEVADGAA